MIWLQKLRIKKASRPLTHHHYHNWWKQENENAWLEQFSRKRNIPPLHFSSVFGDRNSLIFSGRHVFYSCENVQDRFKDYSDHLKGVADLRIGFDYIEDSDYLRFPLWLMYYTDPDSHSPGKDFVKLMNREWRGPRPIPCSLIARHDDRGNGAGLRAKAGRSLEAITPVQYAGKFNNNSKALKRTYDNHTNYYLRDCQFNICLENSNHPGYVTEKVWRPILNGAIPIYWGSDLMPEPDVLSSQAFIPFNPESPEECAKQVEQLLRNQNHLEQFVNQDRTTTNAAEWIDSKLDELEFRLKSI